MLTKTPKLLTTDLLMTLLAQNVPVVIGVSGGKDSCVVAFEVIDFLNQIGHSGPRILIHSDLGRVEWADSLPTCRRLAAATATELVVVRRAAGDLMDRWLVRWENNAERYRQLECVKVILPWSTASMRFCTSELKKSIIFNNLAKNYPGQAIISVTGIRREESPARSKAIAFDDEAKLVRKPKGFATETQIYDWHPILDFDKITVFESLEQRNFALHEAYRTYKTSRVSCAFCILASQADLRAAASCDGNHSIYREMVELEITSTFAFQSGSWLGDVAPSLLDQNTRVRLKEAKERSRIRELAEQRIPPHLLYESGWPKVVPSAVEANLLCQIRQTVAEAVGVSIAYTEPDELISRYRELMEMNARKEAAKPNSIPNLAMTAGSASLPHQLSLF